MLRLFLGFGWNGFGHTEVRQVLQKVCEGLEKVGDVSLKVSGEFGKRYKGWWFCYEGFCYCLERTATLSNRLASLRKGFCRVCDRKVKLNNVFK